MRLNRISRLVPVLLGVIVAALCVSVVPRPVLAQAPAGLTFDAWAGFDGYYRPNDWFPVYVRAENTGGDIDGQIRVTIKDNWGGDIVYTQPALLPTRSRKVFTLYVLITRYEREIKVELVDKGQTLIETEVQVEPVDDADWICGVVSDDAGAMSHLAGLPPIGPGRVHVAHMGLSDLPAEGRSLNSLDVLILHNASTAQLSDRQREALWSWVAFGGHLIVSGGPMAEATADGLDELLPVRIVGTRTTRQDDRVLEALGDFASAPFLVSVPAVVAEVVPLELLAAQDAVLGAGRTLVLAGTPDLPLIVRRELDLGRIDYLALDPDLEPMRTWTGNDTFWPQLFFSMPLGQRTQNARANWGSFNPALANIRSLDLPSVWLVILFLFVYIVVVGPLNLFLLKLWDKRALAWLTIPALILIFSCVAYVFGTVSRGRRVVVSEIAVIRLQPESQTAAIDSYIGLYSPMRKAYDIQVADNRLIHQLESESFGTANIAAGDIFVEQGPPTWVRKFEIDVGAMRGFATHTVQRWEGIEAQLTLEQTTSSTYRVDGTLRNLSDTRLVNGFLMYNSYPISIGDIGPQETIPVGISFSLQQKSAYYAIVNKLVGSFAFGDAGREQDRKRQIASTLLTDPYYQNGMPTQPIPLTGLTLLGWMENAPEPVEVRGALMDYRSTTLLIAPIPVSLVVEPGIFWMPRGSMPWQAISDNTGKVPNITPYMIYPYQDQTWFRFDLGRRDVDIEDLIVHLDVVDSLPTGQVPGVSLRVADSTVWVPLTLNWGATTVDKPERFVQDDGTIDLQVRPGAAAVPFAVDLEAVGH